MPLEPIVQSALIWAAKKTFTFLTTPTKCSRCNHRNADGGLHCCQTPLCTTCIGGMLEPVDAVHFNMRCAFCGTKVTLEFEAASKLLGVWQSKHHITGFTWTFEANGRLTFRNPANPHAYDKADRQDRTETRMWSTDGTVIVVQVSETHTWIYRIVSSTDRALSIVWERGDCEIPYSFEKQ